MRGLRPLDRLRSIKVKLGLLVAASVSVTAVVLYYGLVYLGWLPRYSMPVAVVLALAVTQVLAHGMTSPLRELTAAASAMARGDYSRRVRATSRDEVGEAARAFNRMAEDLATVDKQRRDLVANVSHELRTPISALQAVLENLVDGVSEPDPATLRTALAQTERLGRLVGDLLDLSRLEAGVVPLDRGEVELHEFLRTAAREATVAGRPVEVVVRVQPEGLVAWADRDRLHQLVANLLDNATRHSPPDGTVWLSAERVGRELRIEVADEGPGIPPDQRTRVFDRFHRATAGDSAGTGLGLAIARWVAELHGGCISVVDEPGWAAGGCRIRVDLPGGPA